MLQQFDHIRSTSPRIERINRAAVIARIVPATDTTSRISDLRNLARRYNDMMLDQRCFMFRIAR
jgi:hypothetical protein